MMDKELTEITRRLQPDWPGDDVAAVVGTAYRRLAENARVTAYLPILTERLARRWLNDARRRDGGSDYLVAGGAARNGTPS